MVDTSGLISFYYDCKFNTVQSLTIIDTSQDLYYYVPISYIKNENVL